MKLTAGLLILVLPAVPTAEQSAPVPGPMASLLAPLPAPTPASQEWFGAPVLPDIFRSEEPQDNETPPREGSSRQEAPAAPPRLPSDPEYSWGRGLTALDLQAWQEEDDLKIIREWAGDALLGLPLLLPQLIFEAALPRGFKVGPTTYLYRTDSASSSLVLVVLDQMLFHEAQFLSRVHELSEDRFGGEDLSRGQRRVMRRAFMTGIRAEYAVPGMTLGTVFQTAADHGPAGLLLIPPLGAAVLYFKGIEHKFDVQDQLHVRFKLAGGRDWLRGTWADTGVPTFSFEVKFCNLPVGILGSFELSRNGMLPAFIGIGTTIDVVEDLLGREEHRRYRDE
jgi:hypothetical protein